MRSFPAQSKAGDTKESIPNTCRRSVWLTLKQQKEHWTRRIRHLSGQMNPRLQINMERTTTCCNTSRSTNSSSSILPLWERNLASHHVSIPVAKYLWLTKNSFMPYLWGARKKFYKLSKTLRKKLVLPTQFFLTLHKSRESIILQVLLGYCHHVVCTQRRESVVQQVRTLYWYYQ